MQLKFFLGILLVVCPAIIVYSMGYWWTGVAYKLHLWNVQHPYKGWRSFYASMMWAALITGGIMMLGGFMWCMYHVAIFLIVYNL